MKLELVLDEVPLPWHPTDDWIAIMERLLDGVATADPVLQVVLTDDQTLREHNLEYRNQDAPTDVLSFSYLEGHENVAEELVAGTRAIEDYLEAFDGDDELLAGQVLVSLQTLEERGPVHATDRDGELAFMVVHGLLHVLGHDHAEAGQIERMRRAEIELMASTEFALRERPISEAPGGVKP